MFTRLFCHLKEEIWLGQLLLRIRLF
uniref:Uncharacterized protein n=1 Tax=Anguilla anguilla TaxID=7936 RepID=A0A0E9TK55_ANGAN